MVYLKSGMSVNMQVAGMEGFWRYLTTSPTLTAPVWCMRSMVAAFPHVPMVEHVVQAELATKDEAIVSSGARTYL